MRQKIAAGAASVKEGQQDVKAGLDLRRLPHVFHEADAGEVGGNNVRAAAAGKLICRALNAGCDRSKEADDLDLDEQEPRMPRPPSHNPANIA